MSSSVVPGTPYYSAHYSLQLSYGRLVVIFAKRLFEPLFGNSVYNVYTLEHLLVGELEMDFLSVIMQLSRYRHYAQWFGGLAQLVATLIGSTKLLYAGPG